MNPSTLGLLGLLGWLGFQSAAPNAPAPAVPDVTIKTRRTFDHENSSIFTTIVYLKGARQRREDIVDWPPQVRPGTGSQRTHVGTHISQCDERRTVLLNEEAKTYAYLPSEDPAVYLRRAQTAASRPPQSEPTGGDVTITIDAVDTGERRTMGRYLARRVITTTVTEPGPGASTPPGNNTQDGWYVDLPSANCWDQGDRAGYTFAMTTLASSSSHDRVHISHLGTARRGYPIDEVTRIGNERGTTTSKIELIEFSDAPLDAALFTVPPEYRPALPGLFGGFDLTKPDTVMNRLHSYWDGVRAWADGRLRFVW